MRERKCDRMISGFCAKLKGKPNCEERIVMFYHAFAEQMHRNNATMWNNMKSSYQEDIAEIQKKIAEQERIAARAHEDKKRLDEAIRKNEEQQKALKKQLKETAEANDARNNSHTEKTHQKLKALEKQNKELIAQRNKAIRDEFGANGKKERLNKQFNKHQNAMRDMPQKEVQANKMAEAYGQKAKVKHPYANAPKKLLHNAGYLFKHGTTSPLVSQYKEVPINAFKYGSVVGLNAIGALQHTEHPLLVLIGGIAQGLAQSKILNNRPTPEQERQRIESKREKRIGSWEAHKQRTNTKIQAHDNHPHNQATKPRMFGL